MDPIKEATNGSQWERKTPNSWMILSVTSIGAFLSTLNSTTISVALPTLMKELNVPVTDIGWVIMCFMITVTILVIHAGKLSDRYGRKNLYIAGIAILVLASFSIGFTNSFAWLLILRIMQGIGSAAMMANTSVIVVDHFPLGKRGTVLGINTMAFSAGAVFGPVIGGILLNFSWRWIFWFNVPLGIFLIYWAWKSLPSDRPEPAVQSTGQSFDVAGTLTLLTGLLALLGAFTYGLDGKWDNRLIIGLVIVAILGFMRFIQVERKAKDPIIPLGIFRNRTYAIANVNTFLSSLSRMGVSFVLIFYLQGVLGYTPLAASLILIAMAASMGLTGPFSGWLSDRIGSKLPTAVGLLLSASGLLALSALTFDTGMLYIVICLALIGIGGGLFQSSNALSILSEAPVSQRGVAGGTRLMLNNLGMLLSISMASGLLGGAIGDKKMHDHAVSQADLVPFLRAAHSYFILAACVSFLAMALCWGQQKNGDREKVPGKTELIE